MLKLTALVATIGVVGFAHGALIDFESQAATAGAAFTPQHPGSLLSLSGVGDGVGWNLSRVDGTGFDIMETNGWGPFPASFGTRVLDPYKQDNGSDFQITFDSAISSFSVDAGDYGADVDILVATAYDAFDNVVSTSSFDYGTTGFLDDGTPFATVTVTGAGITKVVFTSQSEYSASLYFDNLRYEATDAVPEPASMAVLGLGAAAFLKRRRKSA